MPVLAKQPPSGGVIHPVEPPLQIPAALHVPPMRQVEPPLQGVPLASCGCVQPPSLSQTSDVQGFPSSVQAPPVDATG